MPAVLEYPKEEEEIVLSDLTLGQERHIALNKVRDYVHISAQTDCMAACSPFRLPILTCKAVLSMPDVLARHFHSTSEYPSDCAAAC